MDEITEGLQPSVIERLGRVIREERDRRGTAFLLIEQNVAFSPRRSADRWAVLELGAVVDSGRSSDPGAATRVAARLSV